MTDPKTKGQRFAYILSTRVITFGLATEQIARQVLTYGKVVLSLLKPIKLDEDPKNPRRRD